MQNIQQTKPKIANPQQEASALIQERDAVLVLYSQALDLQNNFEQDIARLKAELKRTQQSLQAVKEERDSAVSALAASQAECATLKGSLAEAQQTISQLRDEVGLQILLFILFYFIIIIFFGLVV